MSSITKNKDVKMILKGYEKLEYDKLIITKLDETSSLGYYIVLYNHLIA